MYQKNENEHIAIFDVDDTLVTYDPVEGVEPIVVEFGTFMETLYPLYPQIESLKQHKHRGHFIRVHSQGGKDWAECIVMALKLQEYVDSVETKPMCYYDDLPADEWMTRFNPKFK